MVPELDKTPKVEPPAGVSPEAVHAALDKIIHSAAFGTAERPARFLRHLVEAALRGDLYLLKESVLGVDVFERPADWDPREIPVVRQEAARLRKRLARYYETDGSEIKVRIELPVGTYVPVFQHVGEVRAPVEPAPAPSRRWWTYAGAAVTLIAVAAITWRATHPAAPVSIAVLPFTNLSGDPANQYFSDGLTEEITVSLGRVRPLRVISRSSAIEASKKTADIREIGRLLNATNVLEGSVARSGDRMRIIAKLERVSDRALVWSDTYERKASDLFAVQSELAARIARELKAAAGLPPTGHTPNAEALEFAMRGRYETHQLTPEAMAQAELDYRHAIDLDPNYAAAYAGLASAKWNETIAHGSNRTEAERKSVEQLLHKAVELDPDLSGARSMLALSAMQYEWDWGTAERELKLALAGPPGSDSNSFYAFFLICHGRFSEADRYLSRAVELDPYSTNTQNNLVQSRFLEGRLSEAREISQRMVETNPKVIWGPLMIGLMHVSEGHPDLALPVFRQLKEGFPNAQVFEAMACAKAGQREEALRLIRPYEETYPNPGVTAQWLALVYAFMGDEPNTVRWLDRSADQHEFQVLSIAVNPPFAPMRDSPGFRALLKRIGLDR
jgi:TolB-like protein